MVPTVYVEMERLPLTANGKVDRERLPEPGESKRVMGVQYEAPRTAVEKQLARIWAEVLGVERVGIHDDFFALGGHSLLTVRLMTQIEKELGQRLPVAAIFQCRTIEALAEMLRRHTESSPWSSVVELRLPTVDLLAEAELDLETCPEVWPGELVSEPAHILLSGATGFLGVFLLHELLQQTAADIYCLVRAAGIEEARRKLQRTLEVSGLWQPTYRDRIKPVVGDLARPLFGLSPAAFEELSRKLDVIYHNGALVNMVYPYQELKAANVLGTKDILRLATHGKIKPLHYISTLSVFPHKDITPLQFVREQESIDDYHEHVRGGYAQSKWVAEKLVTIARSRGLPVAIYRPGRITGHSQTGAWRADDVLCRMIKGCIQLGSSPIFEDDETLEMTPVDYVSQAIVALARRKAALGQSFHLLNPVVANVNELVGWINAFGYPVRQSPYEQWLRELKLVAESPASNELSPFLSMLPRKAQEEQPSEQAVKVLYDNRNSRLGLASTGITCPPVDAELVHTYLSYMVRSGFLPAPQEAAA
ncbi:MAG TPA: thioester reductase domain-containing protein, partial [Ktedonobacteraceae bacterium]|nr:thioester reductase domain-containing protein [Ktedonobacteraceae bacterium]